MLRLPLTLVLGIEPPPKRHVFDQLCASREGSRSGGDCSRASSVSSLPSHASDAQLTQRFCAPKCSGQGFLPANVLQAIILHADHADLKAMHRVNRAWREAVCYGLHTAAPTTCNPAMLKRFPKLETIGLERLTFTEPHLKRMTGLRTLILHDCSFEHPISELSALTELGRLKLLDVKANSSDMDCLFSNLRALTSLEVFRVSGQKTLPLMSSLASLVSLQELVVSDSHHRERMPHLTQISALHQLRRLTLLKVRVDCSVVRAMANLTNLKSLEIPDCYRVTDSALPCLTPLTGLTRLDLRSTYHRREEDLSDFGMANLASLVQLRALNLAGHRSLTSSGLEFLSSFLELNELSLHEVPLWTGGAAFLSGLTGLTSLNLSRTHMTAEQFTFFRGMRDMKALDVSETFFGDCAALQVAEMSQLETLKASFSALQNQGLTSIAQGCCSLKYANIDGCSVSTLCMLRVLRRRPSLRLWSKGNSSLPNWMYKIDAILIAQTEPYARRLRVLHKGEGSCAKTTGVLLGVIFFFLFYFAALFLVFTAVFLLPLAALGVLCLIVGVLVLTIKVSYGMSKLIYSLVTTCGRCCGLVLPPESERLPPLEPDRLAEIV